MGIQKLKQNKNSCKKSCYSGGSNSYGTKTHEKACSFLLNIHKVSSDKMCKVYYIYIQPHIYTHTHLGSREKLMKTYIMSHLAHLSLKTQ